MSFARGTSFEKIAFLLLIFYVSPARADQIPDVDPNSKSPSKDQVLWTQTNVGYDLESEYNYVGGAPVNFGNGRAGDIEEQYTDIRNIFTDRELMAILFHAGFDWERLGFEHADNTLPVPNQLNSLSTFLAADFRWSSANMVRIQVEPGFYSDMTQFNGNDVNIPIALAYTRVASQDFQWTLALSINDWRENRFLPGGGFRYSINDQWKLKFMLPKPQIEYKANDWVHTWLGADFRGDSYRVASNFGDVRGLPTLNNALVDYQEVRVGSGFSWNIKPLLELNAEAGWMVERSMNYHTSNIRMSSDTGAPYVGINIRVLFQLSKDLRPVKDQIDEMQYQFPGLLRFFKVPQ
jgi:hypothetical protein